MVAAHEQIDVANVIGLENNDGGGRASVEALPELSRIGGRRQGIEKDSFAARLIARGGNDGFPALTRLPMRMFETPYPEARRHVAEFDRGLGIGCHLEWIIAFDVVLIGSNARGDAGLAHRYRGSMIMAQ